MDDSNKPLKNVRDASISQLAAEGKFFFKCYNSLTACSCVVYGLSLEKHVSVCFQSSERVFIATR